MTTNEGNTVKLANIGLNTSEWDLTHEGELLVRFKSIARGDQTIELVCEQLKNNKGEIYTLRWQLPSKELLAMDLRFNPTLGTIWFSAVVPLEYRTADEIARIEAMVGKQGLMFAGITYVDDRKWTENNGEQFSEEMLSRISMAFQLNFRGISEQTPPAGWNHMQTFAALVNSLHEYGRLEFPF